MSEQRVNGSNNDEGHGTTDVSATLNLADVNCNTVSDAIGTAFSPFSGENWLDGHDMEGMDSQTVHRKNSKVVPTNNDFVAVLAAEEDDSPKSHALKKRIISVRRPSDDGSIDITELTASRDGEQSSLVMERSNINLISLVSEMLRNADETIKDTRKKGEKVLNTSQRLRTIFDEDDFDESSSFAQSFAGNEATSGHSTQQSVAELVNERSSFHDSRRSVTSTSFDLIGGGFAKRNSLREKLPAECDPFAIREGMTLNWTDVNFTVKGYGSKPEKQILKDVCGEVPKRETTAIMGSSGAGKSSLLNILAGRTKSGGNVDVKGKIRLDNMPADPTDIEVRQMIAFVAQDDSLQVTATPREAIRFSAKLRLGRAMTDEQLDIMTECMLEELGLIACADTIVGGALIKGISGGERKRTSVGVELVVKPAMVFLDEPTSGLDSFSAVQLCFLLKKVSRAGASVMFTIHQPSSRIFREFDHLILLNKGRVMYSGAVSYVADFFGARGQACPRNYNPADWVMKVAQKVSIRDLEDAGFFPSEEKTKNDEQPIDGSESNMFRKRNQSIVLNNEKPPSMYTEILMLAMREITHIYRARSVTIARVIQTSVLAVVIGLIFFSVGSVPNNSVENLQGHFGAIVMVATIIMMGPAQAALLSFPDERPVFLREYTTNHYSVTSYFLSRLAVEAIMGALQTLVTVLITYYMIDFQGAFSTFYAACFTLAMGSTAVAVIMGAASGSSSKIATAMLPLVLLPQMLFVGYFVAPELIPVWLRWLQYVCPMTYATRILLVDEFYDCSDSFIERIYCQRLLSSTGADKDEILLYWGILVAQFVAFRSIALVILYKSAQKFY